MKLVAVGDNVVDYYKYREEIYPGGNAVNVAVLSQRYGAEACSYIGIVGSDEAGQLIVSSLEEEKVDISRLRYAIGPNEQSIISLNEEGDRVFVGTVSGVQSDLKLNLNPADLDFIRTFDVMHTSIYSHIGSELHKVHGKTKISFDFSTKRDESLLQEICPFLSIAFFSGGDLSEDGCIDLIRKVHGYGVESVGVTRGEKGSIFSDSKQILKQKAIKNDNLVDTLGAGDSFISMFLTRYFQKADLQSALWEAAHAASENCSSHGAYGYGRKKQ